MMAPASQAKANQRAGFHRLKRDDARFVGLAGRGHQIERLSARHPAKAGGTRQR